MSEESKNKSIFRQGNAGEEQTAENLNEYIRTGSAGGYFLIAALIIVVVALFIWGFVGRIPVNITETSVVTGKTSNADLTLCFVDVKKNTGALPKGTVVSLKMPDGETFSGEVIAATEMPDVRCRFMAVNAASDWCLARNCRLPELSPALAQAMERMKAAETNERVKQRLAESGF